MPPPGIVDGPSRRPRTFAFGLWLASRGGLAAAGLVLTALGGLASIAAVIAVGAGRGAAQVPMLASEVIAWSGGMTLAFGAALRALRRDREEGLFVLARMRGVRAVDYVRGRVGGIVALLAVAVGGGTLMAGFAATAAAPDATAAVRASAAGLAYALAFAATLGTMSIAALGARTRTGGYIALLAVLAVPELLAPWTSALLPAGWRELTSIPAALAAVRAGIGSPSGAGVHTARALATLAAVVAASLAVVFARVRIEAEGK
jgi:hypothetical protein